jgi:hypothetical protein
VAVPCAAFGGHQVVVFPFAENSSPFEATEVAPSPVEGFGFAHQPAFFPRKLLKD